MSARVTVSTQAVASPPAGVVTDSGRAFIVGQTPKGPASTPTLVQGLADYRATFGGRTGGTDMYDAVSIAFAEGLGSAYILRAVGPSPVNATASLDTGKIVATSRFPGAAYNTWTVAYTSATKTITVVKDTGTVTYTGGTAALLEAAADLDPDLTFTVSSLPSGDVAAAPLATGTDDYGNAVPATVLAYLDADLGDGAVAWPGQDVATIGAALQTHCEAANRIGITSMANYDDTSTEAIAAAAAVTDGTHLVLGWPYVTVANASLGTITCEPVGFMLGVRGRAHGSGTPAQSPIADQYGRAKYITGVVEDTTAAEWVTLNAGNVSVIRTSNSTLRMYGWRTIDAPDGVANLQPAQHRDTINRVAAGCEQIAESFVGRIIDGKGQALGEFAGALTGFLSGMSQAFYAGTDDPGYVVDAGPGINPTTSLAAGDVAAAVGVRLAPGMEMITIEVTATDAAGAL